MLRTTVCLDLVNGFPFLEIPKQMFMQPRPINQRAGHVTCALHGCDWKERLRPPAHHRVHPRFGRRTFPLAVGTVEVTCNGSIFTRVIDLPSSSAFSHDSRSSARRLLLSRRRYTLNPRPWLPLHDKLLMNSRSLWFSQIIKTTWLDLAEGLEVASCEGESFNPHLSVIIIIAKVSPTSSTKRHTYFLATLSLFWKHSKYAPRSLGALNGPMRTPSPTIVDHWTKWLSMKRPSFVDDDDAPLRPRESTINTWRRNVTQARVGSRHLLPRPVRVSRSEKEWKRVEGKRSERAPVTRAACKCTGRVILSSLLSLSLTMHAARPCQPRANNGPRARVRPGEHMCDVRAPASRSFLSRGIRQGSLPPAILDLVAAALAKFVQFIRAPIDRPAIYECTVRRSVAPRIGERVPSDPTIDRILVYSKGDRTSISAFLCSCWRADSQGDSSVRSIEGGSRDWILICELGH